MPLMGRYRHDKLATYAVDEFEDDAITDENIDQTFNYYPVIFLGEEKYNPGTQISVLVEKIYLKNYSALGSIINPNKPSIFVSKDGVNVKYHKQYCGNTTYNLNDVLSISTNMKRDKIIFLTTKTNEHEHNVHVYLCNNNKAPNQILEDCRERFELNVNDMKWCLFPDALHIDRSTDSNHNQDQKQKNIISEKKNTNKIENETDISTLADDFGDFQSVFTDSFRKTKNSSTEKIEIYQKINNDENVENNDSAHFGQNGNGLKERPRSSLFSSYTKLENKDDLLQF